MSATILASMKSELARLEGRRGEFETGLNEAGRAYQEATRPYFNHCAEIARLKRAIKVLEEA